MVVVLSGSVLRAKGIVYYGDDPEQAVAFNVVGSRVSQSKIEERSTEQISRILIIGREDSANTQLLEAGFSDSILR